MLSNYSRALTSTYMILNCTSKKVGRTLCDPLDAGWSLDPASGFDLQGKIGKHTGDKFKDEQKSRPRRIPAAANSLVSIVGKCHSVMDTR